MIPQQYKSFIIIIFISLQSIFPQEKTNNEPTFFRTIEVKRNGDLDPLIYEHYFQKLVGTYFKPELLELEIKNILSFYENSGYPFTGVKIESILFEVDSNKNNVVDIFISITSEELQKIDKVLIEGNTKTDEKVIINQLRLKKGEIYSQEKINRIPILLNKLRFFEPVQSPQYFVDNDNNGVLNIKIKERNTNSFDGILGYVPSRNDNEDGYFTGFVNITLRNLFGTGRGASVKWQQESSATQELSLKYLEPWLFDYPFNLTFEFFQRKQDSTYVKRTFGTGLEFLANENISASLLLETEATIPSLNENIQNTVLSSTSLNTGLQLKVDYRDDNYFPTDGIIFGSTYKYRQKEISGSANPSFKGNINYHNYELMIGGYYSYFDNQVMSVEIQAKEINGDYFDISDYYQFGGTNSLRGYRENSFLGNRIIWSNLEYRFLLAQRSYLFTFFDFGYYLLNNNSNEISTKQEKYLNGYGFGISLDTALGIMKVSYAFTQGNSLLNGLLHFGLVNEF